MKYKLKDYDFSQKEDDDSINTKLYRFGYIANIGMFPRLTESLQIQLSAWVNQKIGTLHICMHPETPAEVCTTQNTQVVILGHVFDAITGLFDGKSIANDLSQFPSPTRDFLNYLDNLGGRYVIFVNFGTGWEVYPDAFSSKMRYFSDEYPGMVASHSSLFANASGAQLDFDMYGFILSPAYREKNVKNLPGLATEYENVYVAPANQKLDLTQSRLVRFWPRENIRHNDEDLATSVFVKYLDTYSDFIKKTFSNDIFGLTGGMDSRTMLAPLLAKNVKVDAFTLLRGGKSNLEDLETAKQLAAKFGFSHQIVNVSSAESRNANYFANVRKVLRQVGGPQRLNALHSNDSFYREFSAQVYPDSNFTRGFGGEIIRGFYQRQGKPLKKATPSKFAGMMGIHGASELSKLYFQHFIDNLDYESCYDADLFDIYYMEHRMSKWGANALTEADLTAHSMVGMACRKLYGVNMGLPLEVRTTRNVFKNSVLHFMPELLDIEVC